MVTIILLHYYYIRRIRGRAKASNMASTMISLKFKNAVERSKFWANYGIRRTVLWSPRSPPVYRFCNSCSEVFNENMMKFPAFCTALAQVFDVMLKVRLHNVILASFKINFLALHKWCLHDLALPCLTWLELPIIQVAFLHSYSSSNSTSRTKKDAETLIIVL